MPTAGCWATCCAANGVSTAPSSAIMARSRSSTRSTMSRADRDEAARLALAAGVDCDLPDGLAYRTLADAGARGQGADGARSTRPCARMLTLKFRAGLFEASAMSMPRAPRADRQCRGARAGAGGGAQVDRACSSNDGTLPLDAGARRRVAVIGPNAAIARLGGYSSVADADGLPARRRPRAARRQGRGRPCAGRVHHRRARTASADEVLLADPAKNRALIAEAVEVARGRRRHPARDRRYRTDQPRGLCARTISATAPSSICVGEQNALFDALHAPGKPVVVVAINGRPPSWPTVVAKAPTRCSNAGMPGQEGGTAMAEALFGDVNPGAKLPVTVVRDVGPDAVLLQPQAIGAARLSVRRRSAAVPVRPRAQLHQLRRRRAAPVGDDDRPGGTVDRRGRRRQYRRTRRRRGRPALYPRLRCRRSRGR